MNEVIFLIHGRIDEKHAKYTFSWRVLEENFKSKHFSYLARIYTFADVLIVSIAKNVFVFG